MGFPLPVPEAPPALALPELAVNGGHTQLDDPVALGAQPCRFRAHDGVDGLAGRGEFVDDFGKAVTDMVRFVRMHPTSIAQKVEVTVEHFRRNVMHHLGGTAKAMVVTADRMAAVTWSLKMNEYIAKRGYSDMTTLVAFSGSLTYGEGGNAIEVTEASMNSVPDTAMYFREHNEAKVLIVANKFQTGFDEPRLCAMYVDRKLSGVQAVQTLSRLNRVFPDKPKSMVVIAASVIRSASRTGTYPAPRSPCATSEAPWCHP